MSTAGGAQDNNVVTSSTPTKLQGLDALTLTGWFNLQAEAANLDRLVSFADTGGNGFELWFNGANTIFTLNVDLVQADSAAVSGGFATDSWIFYALTYDGTQTTNNLNFYLADPSSAVTQLGTTLSLNAGTTGSPDVNFEVAGSGRSGLDRTPNAFLSDIRVYEGVLNLAELEAVRVSAVPEPATALLLLGSLGLLALRRRQRGA